MSKVEMVGTMSRSDLEKALIHCSELIQLTSKTYCAGNRYTEIQLQTPLDAFLLCAGSAAALAVESVVYHGELSVENIVSAKVNMAQCIALLDEMLADVEAS